jgi:DNA-binding transcriptional MerR regulator
MNKASQPRQGMGLFPEKLFFRIGETSRLVGVEACVLRYWESEFAFLSPRKGKSGQRIYTAEDIGILLQIKRLLYEERYTIDGANKQLAIMLPEIKKQAMAGEIPAPDPSKGEIIGMVQQRLRRMLETFS